MFAGVSIAFANISLAHDWNRGADGMGQEIENGHIRFINIEAELRTSLRAPMNESDTRFQVLDRILTEVLGWDRQSIKTEPPTPEGFIDYLLITGEQRSAFVVEAKRNGRLTPNTNSKGMIHLALNGPVLKPLADAVKQAFRYAADEGVPFAAVTDGSCWLFFRASRTDGKKPMDGKAILFRDLDAVRDNFTTFYELASPIAFLERRNAIHLAKAEGLAVADAEEQFCVSDPKLARMLPEQDLASDARLLFTQFFSKLSEEDEEMLTECFVETSESRKAETELEKIAQTLVNSVKTLETSQGLALQQEVKRAVATQQSETVLILGNKGSGKSTFMRRFFKGVLHPQLRSQCAVMRVDLEGFHGSNDDVQTWVFRELRKQAEKIILSKSSPTYDDLQGVFWEEYVRWRDVSHSHLYEADKVAFKIEFEKHVDKLRSAEPDEYVRHLLRRSSVANRQLPCVVYDNTDQFGADVQDQVYQLAHSLGVATPILNIVPITDRTVWRLGKSGALQSYAARSFYLPVPEAKQIIARRVTFVKSKLERESTSSGTYFSAKGFQVGLKDLKMITNSIESVLVQQDYVSGLIGRLGNFDIRRMLRIAERIFLSPEIRIDEIVRSHFSGRPITADGYRTYRALIKGAYDRFSDDENEFVTNLFWTDRQQPSSPLLQIHILTLLKAKAVGVTDAASDRHWLVSDLIDYLEIVGSAPETTQKTVQHLLDRGLVEEFDPNVILLQLGHRVAIKEAGGAHLDMAYSSTTYIEQCALATGLNDRSVHQRMKDLFRRPNRENFFAIRNIFIDYLLKADAVRLTIPSHPDFRALQEVRNKFRTLKAAS